MDVLRGAADRQRHAGRAPHRGPGLQGPVPPVQDHAGVPRHPQGRLGLPRAARRGRRREGTRPFRQEGHRGLRRRRVQRAVPGVGAAARRRVLRAHHPDGLLDRPVHRLPHHGRGLRGVRLVGAEDDLRQGPAGPGLPDQPVLPAVRHAAVRPRDGPAGRLPGRRRPVGDRPVPVSPRSPTGANPHLAGADLLVWTTTPWTLVSNTAIAVHPEVEYVVAPQSTRRRATQVVVAEALWPRVLGEGWHVLATLRGSELLGASYAPPFGIARYSRRAPGGERHLRDHRGRDRPGAPGAGLRRRRPGGDPRRRDAGGEPGARRTGGSTTGCRWSAGCSSRTPTSR